MKLRSLKVSFMKIYFAGAIQGGRHNQEWYRDIIKHLGQYGEVLTQRIGAEDLDENGEKHFESEEVYDWLMERLEEADILVAEVSTPSLGVGYEIAVAEEMDKKILCLFRRGSGRRLSAMIEGNKNIDVVYYDKLSDAQEAIEEYFEEIQNSKLRNKN